MRIEVYDCHNAQETSRNAMPHHINRKPTSELARLEYRAYRINRTNKAS